MKIIEIIQQSIWTLLSL